MKLSFGCVDEVTSELTKLHEGIDQLSERLVEFRSYQENGVLKVIVGPSLTLIELNELVERLKKGGAIQQKLTRGS